ncbi:hypothetical protein DRQ00_10600 [candidate division KSB1 bacterium]|nr:MAG: hypothetical protein DRQ00_10600 [candidate division KSB1 bacterium]
MQIRTHLSIQRKWVGQALEVETDHFARASLVTTDAMVVDERGLVHGGFSFGLADYAAMLAVNHPNVVLTSVRVNFVHPVKVGDILLALARVVEKKENKRKVQVEIRVADHAVLEGEFYCVILEKHVFDVVGSSEN